VTTVPLRFADAYHVTSGTDGPSAVAGCQLDLGRRGVTVRDPDGTPAWSAPWAAVTGLAVAERTTLPDGRTGIVVHVGTAADGSGTPDVHRVVVPAEQPAVAEEQLAALARSRGLEPGGPPAPASVVDGNPTDHSTDQPPDQPPDGADRSLPFFVVVPTVVVVAAVVAVLLLAAGHIIHL
jgi:hypothetical protein